MTVGSHLSQVTRAAGWVFAVMVGVSASWQAVEHGIVASALPQPKVVSPVSVKVIGPSEILAGRAYWYHLEVTGEHGRPEWRVLPDVVGALTVEADGLRAKFQTEEPAAYAIIVSIAGGDRNVASDVVQVANLDGAPLTTEIETVAHADLASPPQPITASAPAEPALVDVVAEIANTVESDQRAVESRKVASAVIAVVGRLEAGLIAPDRDPLVICEEETNLILGDSAESWRIFWDQVRAAFGMLRNAGRITTAASYAEPLREVAKALKRVP